MNIRILFLSLTLSALSIPAIGQTFSTPISISTDSGAHSPAMHVGRDGTIYVSWFENNADIYFSHSTDGGTSFTPPVRVSKQVTTNNYASLLQRAPNFALDIKGVIHLVWMEARILNAQSDIWYTRSTDDGTTWIPPQSIMDPGDSIRFAQDYPAIAIDSSNNLYACYIDNRYLMRGIIPHYKLQLERSTDGGQTWSNPVIADKLPFTDAGTCECCRDDIAVSPEGHVYIAFRTSMTEGTSRDMRDIFIARSMDSGRTFDSSIQCQLGDWNLSGCPTKGPQIALDGNENLHVAWADARDDSNKLIAYYSMLRPGDSAVFPNYSAGSRGLPDGEWPDLAIAPDGTIAYAYTVSGPNLLSYSSDGGNTWHRSMPLPGGSSDAHTIPALAFDASGNLFAAWQDANANGILFTKITALAALVPFAVNVKDVEQKPDNSVRLSWWPPFSYNPFVWYDVTLGGPDSAKLNIRDTTVTFDSLPSGEYHFQILAHTSVGRSQTDGYFNIPAAKVTTSENATEESEAYPDPVTNGTLRLLVADNAREQLTIIDSKGSVVKQFAASPNAGTIPVDVRDLPSGAYTCEITGKTLRRVRFIIP